MALQPGDHILTTTHDFYSTHEALRLAAARTGAEVERIALYDDPAAASADVMVGRLAAAVRPATRIVALTWVHSSTGVKTPVRQIAMYSLRSTATATLGSRPGCTSTPSTAWALIEDGPPELGCDVFISGTYRATVAPAGRGRFPRLPADHFMTPRPRIR
jgi:aspartate aminotransferase-like enzyme